MAKNKKPEDMTSEDYMAKAKELIGKAQDKAKPEIEAAFTQIVKYARDIKNKMAETELAQDIDEYFENHDVLAELREFIADKKAGNSSDAPAKPQAGKRQTWTPEQKAGIIKKYDAARAGTKGAVLEAHGVKGNPIASWKNNANVKMAMQKIQEKK